MIKLSPKELSMLAINGFGAMQKYEELEALIGHVDKLKPKTILEIGVGKGGTSWCWTKLTSPTLILGVDMVGGPWGGGPDDRTIEYISSNSHCEYSFINGDSCSIDTHGKVCELLFGQDVDFLMIDGDHSYEGVKADWERYSPLVAPGGWVALHDVCEHPPEAKCEVKQFWDELKRDNPAEMCEFISEPQTWGGIALIQI